MQIGPDHPNCHYRVSVRALITNKVGEVLVVRENGRDWDLPGGGLDWGEDPIDGLKRELIEEIGCSGEISALPILVVPWTNDTLHQHLLWLVYRVSIDENEITSTEYVSEYCYLSYMNYISSGVDKESEWKSATNYQQDMRDILSNL